MTEMHFAPAKVTLKAGTTVEIKLVEVKFTPKKTGTFEIGCHVEGHYEAGMKGSLTIK
jgi:uncharacterized cupredoxin-like copper-binding protein